MRKQRVILTLVVALAIGAIAYLLSPPPKPEPYRETISRGEYIQSSIQEDNTFHDYLSAARLHREVPDDISDEFYSFRCAKQGEKITEVSDAIRAYVKGNEPAIDMVRKAIAKNNCVVPKVTTFSDLLPYLSEFRSLARIMVAEGKIKGIDGDHKGAYRDYLDTMRFGQDISEGGVLIHGLVSIAICSVAASSVQSGLKTADAKTLEMVVGGLEEVEGNSVPYSEVLKNEFEVLLKAVEYSMRRRGNLSFLIHPPKPEKGELVTAPGHIVESNLKYNARWLWICLNKGRIRRDVKNMTKTMIKSADMPIYENERAEFEKSLPKDIISKVFLPAFGTAKISYAMNYATLRGTRLRAAVELYQRKHDEFPRDLNVLVSAGVIKQIPVDPFTDEPFKYVDGRIYSIGKDFKDDKGLVRYGPKKESNYNQEGDLVF